MKRFDLIRPGSVEEACAVLSDESTESKIIGGGTALVILLKQKVFAPEKLVSVKDIPGLSYIEYDPSTGLRLGANTSQHAVEMSELLKREYPLLAVAASKVGNIRVRTMSTVGGTVCEADHQSDLPPTLMALGAVVVAQGPEGRRTIPISEFYVGPYETVLAHNEMVVEVQVPPMRAGSAGVYLKHVTGPITDRPCLGVAAVCGRDGSGRVDHVSIVLGGIAGVPWRPEGAEEVLRGSELDDETIRRAAEAAYEAAEPMGDLRGSAWYKKEMVKVFVARALTQLREKLDKGEK